VFTARYKLNLYYSSGLFRLERCRRINFFRMDVSVKDQVFTTGRVKEEAF
jgi:hypothetical protein